MSVSIPDPQLAYRESLDEAFDNALDIVDKDELEYWCERWTTCVHSEPLVYSADDIYEMGPDIEENLEIIDIAMSKDIQHEIQLKRRVLEEMKEQYG
jgi:hypothetical protein